MGEPANSQTPPVHHAFLTLIGPRTQALVGACILVLTGYTLGLDWLATRLIGLPAGLWLVGLASLIAEYRRQSDLPSAAPSAGRQPGIPGRPDPTRLRLPRINLDTLRAPFNRPAFASGAVAVENLLGIVGFTNAHLDTARRTLTELSSKVVPPASTLRIGVDLADADAAALIALGSLETYPGPQIEWVRARSGLITDVEPDIQTGGFDLLIRRESRGDINLFVAEQDGRTAAWSDWSMPLPLGYAGVFPPRIDPGRIALCGCDIHNTGHASVAARMAVACAMLARVPGRSAPGATSSLGRALTARPAIPTLTRPSGPLAAAMAALAAAVTDPALAATSPFNAPPAFIRAAARVCSAHLVASTSAALSHESVTFLTTVADLLGGEPEVLLRLAAACFSRGALPQAHHAMLEACRTLALHERRCDADPLAFIMSEVELGEPGPGTLGRIAAGIALTWATSPADTVDYLREDLLDDLAHAGWLRERPDDVHFLKGVIDTLEAASAPLRAAA